MGPYRGDMREALSPGRSPPPKRTAIILICVLGGLVLLSGAIGLSVGLLIPSMGAAREAKSKKDAGAALTRIAASLRAYAADYAGALPADDTAIVSQLVPAYLDKAPTIGPPGTLEPSWRYVPLGNLRVLADPATKIMAFELPGHWTRAGGHVLYADGVVKWIDGLRFDEMVKPFMPPPSPLPSPTSPPPPR